MLHQTLADWTSSRIESDLEARAELIVNALNMVDTLDEKAQLVDSLGGPTDQRITLIDADGTVLADTYVDDRDLAALDNHGERPEVQASLDGELGMARRHSTSVDADMLYVAIPIPDSDAVLRASVPLREVDEALRHLRLLLLFGGVLGIGVAILMSSIASRLMSQTLQQVLDRARTDTDAAPAAGASPGADTDVDGDDSDSLRQITRALEETLELLVRQRNRFRAVLDGMTEGVIATDSDLQITLSNRSVHRLLNTDGDLEDRPLSALLPDDIIEAIVEDSDDTVEFQPSHRPVRRIRIRTTPRPDTGGYILVFHDVTTIRRLETMRRDFVANVSHELKTPVTVIQANAETLLDGALGDAEHARTFTEGIDRNARRLSRLISDLLDLSQIEAGEIEIELQQTPLRAVVEDAVVDIEHRVNSSSTSIDIDIDEELRVQSDFDALYRVLLNLLENAVKYGGDDPTVQLHARRRQSMVLVEVIDNGPGIPGEHRDRLFERFYRVDRGRTVDMGGTGLGLAIVKHLVASMHGEVGYRPAEPEGSIFWFTLPAAKKSGDDS